MQGEVLSSAVCLALIGAGQEKALFTIEIMLECGQVILVPNWDKKLVSQWLAHPNVSASSGSLTLLWFHQFQGLLVPIPYSHFQSVITLEIKLKVLWKPGDAFGK